MIPLNQKLWLGDNYDSFLTAREKMVWMETKKLLSDFLK